ncbi:MAG: hypothetical protein ACFFFC_01020 [Candidatus Thorarchaeota archaeon]
MNKNETNLGTILIRWRVITVDQLNKIFKENGTLRSVSLGKLLVAKGLCSREELSAAMTAQKSMQSAKSPNSAIAMANVALERRHGSDTIQQLIKKGNELAKTLSGISCTNGFSTLAKTPIN